MFSSKIFALSGVMTLVTFTFGSPDSAGLVELPPGLAYGGIPYGSVSGMLSSYPNALRRNDYPVFNEATPSQYQQIRQMVPRPIIITPNVRAPGLETRQRGPVQIYNLPGVVAPGVLGTISQIGY